MRDPLMSVKEIAKRHLSPFMLHCVKQAYHRVRYGGPEWEFCPQGWITTDSKIKGWNVDAIARTQQVKWPAFLQAIKGTGPLTIAHEAPMQSEKNFDAHHLLMAYAYVLTLAALKKDKIALLDWGGGIGHYCLLSRCILPELLIEYSCKDLPMLCTAGRELLTEATFYEADDEIAGRHYDLVLASGSLQYAEDWKSVIRLLAGSASPYLFVTRLPVVRRCRSFVVRQRVYAYGYESEYFSWIFNREEVIDTVVSEGCELVREFLFHEHPHVSRAPEQAEVTGFLFRNRNA